MKRVACAISGGVDSAVAAALLKRKGFDVLGVFMQNWDQANEKGVCTANLDWEDAQYVCERLRIPLEHTNFVKEYWNDVFSEMLAGYEGGNTPNPDVLCNKHIKFGAFFRHVMKTMDVDAIATGHYAQNSYGNFLEHPHQGKARLLLSKDRWKDQTLFLAQISQEALQKTMFPVGGLYKRDVKNIAQSLGIERIVQKKESMGICFIGTRKFSSFIEQYIEPKRGLYIDVETGEALGEHKGTHYFTIGQRAPLPGMKKKYFIASVDPTTQNVYVAPGTHHPSLYASCCYTHAPHWIAHPPKIFSRVGDSFTCGFKFQHIHTIQQCTIQLVHNNAQAYFNDMDVISVKKKHSANADSKRDGHGVQNTFLNDRTHIPGDNIYSTQRCFSETDKHTINTDFHHSYSDQRCSNTAQNMYSTQNKSIYDDKITNHGNISEDVNRFSECYRVDVEEPIRALTPGQFATFYEGEECLGSAQISRIGPTLYAQGISNIHGEEPEYETRVA